MRGEGSGRRRREACRRDSQARYSTGEATTAASARPAAAAAAEVLHVELVVERGEEEEGGERRRRRGLRGQSSSSSAALHHPPPLSLAVSPLSACSSSLPSVSACSLRPLWCCSLKRVGEYRSHTLLQYRDSRSRRVGGSGSSPQEQCALLHVLLLLLLFRRCLTLPLVLQPPEQSVGRGRGVCSIRWHDAASQRQRKVGCSSSRSGSALF
eukprot:2128249-Rhodomonas_salina.1